MRPKLEILYRESVLHDLRKKFGYANIMQVPRLVKITLNMGIGEAIADKKIVANAVDDLSRIAGQKAAVTLARKSIAGFKVRLGWPIGCKVTLRGGRMYDFFDRLISVVIPRIRDFRGLSQKSFDGRGNYNLGIREQIVFPEINYDKIDAIRGLDIAISTTAKKDEEAIALLLGLGFPLKETK